MDYHELIYDFVKIDHIIRQSLFFWWLPWISMNDLKYESYRSTFRCSHPSWRPFARWCRWVQELQSKTSRKGPWGGFHIGCISDITQVDPNGKFNRENDDELIEVGWFSDIPMYTIMPHFWSHSSFTKPYIFVQRQCRARAGICDRSTRLFSGFMGMGQNLLITYYYHIWGIKHPLVH